MNVADSRLNPLRRKGFLVVAVLGLVLSGCQGHKRVADSCANAEYYQGCDFDRQKLAPNNPCRFIRWAEARSVIDLPLNATPGWSEQAGWCAFAFRTPGDFKVTFLSGSDVFAAYSDAVHSLREQVSSVGDQAFWDAHSRTLHVRTTNGYLKLEMPTVADAQTKAITLARIALPRIQA